MGTMLWFGGIIELLGGLLIAIGLFTRPAAFIASGMTAVAYWYFHAGRGFFPILNAGELAALYSFVFLYSGPWSLERRCRSRAARGFGEPLELSRSNASHAPLPKPGRFRRGGPDRSSIRTWSRRRA